MPRVPDPTKRLPAPRRPGAPRAGAARAAPPPPLRLRAPGRALRFAELVGWLRPAASAEAVAAAIRRGGLRVDGRPLRDPGALVAPGSLVEGALSLPAERAALRDDAVAARWLALTPAPPWPAGRFARVATPAAPEGETELRGPGAAASAAPVADDVAWRALETRDGVACLAIEGFRGGARALRRRLAEAGFPVLGDVAHGGVVIPGGLRLRAAAAGEEEGERLAWPDEPVFPGEREDGGRARLAVSASTLRAIARGHPWVLTDSETGDAARFRPGTIVQLEAVADAAAPRPRAPRHVQRGRGARGATRGDVADAPVLVRIEGAGALAARVWEPRAVHGQRPRSVEARVADALARRRALLASGETDCLRLVHGEADGFPGLAIDRVGVLLRVLVTGRACEPVVERALDVVVASLRRELGPDPPVVRVLHLRERPPGRYACVALVRGRLAADALDAEGRVTVSERGLRFLADPGLGAPEQPSPAYGFFPDQRANRARLAAVAAGGRWLNLFAHTGAFSVALLAAGAAQVTSVDLSAAYLRWLDENLARNALAGPRHVAHRGDGRRYFARLAADERFDGIVLDPPTAAAAGRRFWSVRRDLPALLETALGRLAPGGRLLVTRNDRSGRGHLGDLVREASGRAGCPVAELHDAPPSPDFPRLRGFPEGDAFDGALLRRSLHDAPDRADAPPARL